MSLLPPAWSQWLAHDVLVTGPAEIQVQTYWWVFTIDVSLISPLSIMDFSTGATLHCGHD